MRTSGVADLAGRVLAGRYRLIAPIGTGASGRVYAAWDVRLRRRVAVKVLHTALADDAGFLRRFGAEAQLAASLHHPNVVAVYDWGEDETPFMVLELLEGGSLRALLDRGSRLDLSQAASVGRQVCAALEYAHTRGLVHRDVKPANLLFDEHGALRVADFGLARALAEASWTEPAGAMLGTIRYAAPEQVHGVVDARSDLYSLALVLIEAVTGGVPFAGETSLSTLLSRVERHLAAPAELGPLAPVLERAGRADPADRWPDAAAFAAALADAAEDLPPPSTLPLAAPVLEEEDPHPTAIPLVGAAPTTPAPVGPPGPGAAAPAPPVGTAPMAPVPPVAPVTPRSGRRRGTGRRRLVPVVMLLLVVLAAATAAYAVGRAAGPRVRVPNVVGLTLGEARSSAGRVELGVRQRTVDADDPAGTVVSQDPAPGTILTEGRRVELLVSGGPAPVAVPGVVGQEEQAARQALEAAGFEVTLRRAFDDDVDAGLVLDQDPPGDRPVAPGGAVRLTVSDGPRPVVVPNVVGRAYERAADALEDKRLNIRRTEAFSDSVEAGDVIRQDPVAGEEARPDSTVTVVVSKGPDIVKVPDVRGEDVEDAVEILQEADFEVDVVGYRPGRSVKRQDPSAGRTVRRGETVTLFL